MENTKKTVLLLGSILIAASTIATLRVTADPKKHFEYMQLKGDLTRIEAYAHSDDLSISIYSFMNPRTHLKLSSLDSNQLTKKRLETECEIFKLVNSELFRNVDRYYYDEDRNRYLTSCRNLEQYREKL